MAEDYDLTTIAKARLNVLGDSTDDAQDELLEDLVDAFSLAVINYVRRQFMPTETAVTKRFSYNGGGILDLTVIDDMPHELTAVTQVVLFSDLPVAYQVPLANGDASSEADYRLNPRNKTRELTYTWLMLPQQTGLAPSVPSPSSTMHLAGDQKEYEVAITGNWGAGVVPSIVERVVLREIANAYRNPEGFQQRSMGEFSVSEPLDVAGGSGFAPLSWGSKRLLEPYRRPVIG